MINFVSYYGVGGGRRTDIVTEYIQKEYKGLVIESKGIDDAQKA